MTKTDQIYTAEILGKSLSSTKDVLRNEEIQPTNLENGQLDGSDISKNSLDPTAPMQGAQLPSQTGKSGMALFSNGTSAYWAEILIYMLHLTKSIDDLGYVGATCSFTAGEAISAGAAVYVKNDGKVYKSNANAAATMPVIGIAPVAINSAASGLILMFGIYRNDTLFNWTTGNILYATNSAGALANSTPAGLNYMGQAVAVALSADIVFVNPQLTLVTRSS